MLDIKSAAKKTGTRTSNHKKESDKCVKNFGPVHLNVARSEKHSYTNLGSSAENSTDISDSKTIKEFEVKMSDRFYDFCLKESCLPYQEIQNSIIPDPKNKSTAYQKTMKERWN